ncbi:1386_t:CDS:2 [Funneliformis mosseae]|uniref:1386_t:CDS:1 n=1 Tax=Funneliformis mosseae TaxID=27381 RepID=A0A9N9BRA0_FUNMO|nr:1386_t:CDS:2 [Funneliformis mosseae]
MLTYSRSKLPHQRMPSIHHHHHHIINKEYDMIIYVGEEPSIKTFHAHSNILRDKSPYFLAALSSNWIQRENGMIVYRKPNISPEIFEVILSFCYTNYAKLSDKDGKFIIELLISADEMIFTSFINYIQKNFTTAQLSWLQENCLEITQFAFKYPSFQALQHVCLETICENPSILFKSPQFTSFESNILLGLLQRNELNLYEVELWDYIIHWGIKQNPNIPVDPSSWSRCDIIAVKSSIEEYLPYIRFCNMTQSEFQRYVWPYRTLIPYELYDSIMTNFIMPLFKCKQVMRQRGTGIQSRLINWDHLSYICGWIDRRIEPYSKPCVSYLQRGCKANAIYKLNSDVEVINFGNGDLRLDNNFNESFSCSARKHSYEMGIRSDTSSFCVEEFEVFKIINRNE